MLAADQFATLLEVEDLNALKVELNRLPAVDVGSFIELLSLNRRAIAFRLLNKSQATDVFEYLTPEARQELIGSLHDSQVRQIIETMRPDDRVELFDELPAGVVKRLIQQLSPSEREATALILGYAEGTAGRVMTTEYVRLNENLTVEQAIQKIRSQDMDKETIYYAYITDDSRKLVRVVSLRQLLFAGAQTPVRDIAFNTVVKASTDTPQEEVARIMKRYDLLALPIVDREERLVGIVTIDDVVDILEEEATEDIQKLAGVSGGDEKALSAPLVTMIKRLPWLVANIGLYIAAASAIAPFQGLIAIVPVIAVIMPILSNTSGNVAIQALSVTVRGLGVGEVTPADTFRILRKEVLAGLGTALVLGLLLGVLSLIWSSPETRWVALVASAVMMINVLVAASLGTILPMALKRAKLDPALISGPLLTTVLDAVGFFTFLSLVTAAFNFVVPR